jgi:predicted unusual protein kinase regulating ubiquinone biosynthesis (AarF/ABC1/UbiB family)
MAHKGDRSIPKSRLGRLSMLGGLAGRLATDLAGTAGYLAVGKTKDQAASLFHRQAAERLVGALGKMKGLPMKVGQMISYIDDFIPPEHRDVYRRTLASLQRHARPMRYREMAEQVRRDLGAAPEQVFLNIVPEPIAAASIGQVYRATTKDGRDVAVKVQYPGIKEAIENDIKNIDVLRSAMSMILPKVDVERSIEDLTSRVLEECDYGCELNNQEDFRRAWEADAEVHIPRPIPELSGDHVLVTELVEGDHWSEMLEKTSAAERTRHGLIIARFVFRSLYVHGMFNADPHPGNYIFMKDRRVAFIDFGCVQRYARETVEAFKRARDSAMQGVKGAEFQRVIMECYELPDDLDEEDRVFMEEYVKCCFYPVLAPQPFKYGRAYTQQLADLTMKGARLGAKKAFRRGVWEAKRPGLVFLNRINFGLNSILSALDAEADWRELLRAIDEEGVRERARGSASR